MERRRRHCSTMTFEEKILAYLDDSLPAEQREEVLHEAHSSREARALLDAHVRMGSLYALTARPVSAPLDIQRELAAKVPILAVKLPYLAMPEKRRRGIVAWLWESKLNAVLLLLAALLAAGIWYVASGERSNISRSVPGSTTNTATHPPAGGSGGSIAANHSSTPSHSGAAGNTPRSIAPSGAASPLTHLKRETTTKASRTNSEPSRMLRAYDKTASNERSDRLSAMRSIRQASTNAARAIETTPNVPTESAIVEPPIVTDTFLLPPLHAVATSPQPIALPTAAPAIPIAISGSSNGYTPLRAFVEANIRSTRLAPQARPSDYARKFGVWQNSVTSAGEEFGIDYELSPWIAIGVRGGNARFVQAQPVVHSVPVVGSYGRISHTVTETALLDPFAPWACAAATFVVNPDSRLQYEFTAGGGNVFLSGFSPTALGEAAVTYRMASGLAVRASLSYQASWTTAASSIVSDNSRSSVGGAAVLSTSPKLFASQALGFSIGVAIHP